MSILYVVAVASAVIAAPTSPGEPRQARVKYSDLNLSSPVGQTALDRRLKLALNMVCGRKPGQSSHEWLAVRRCQKRAMTQVEPQRAFAIAQSGVKVAGGN